MHPLLHPLFVDYCAYFNGNQDYFECHEVLEEYWKDIAPGNKNHPLVGYIQLATGFYHWRRNNYTGAQRILNKTISNFSRNKDCPFFEYIDFPQLLKDCTKTVDAIQNRTPFVPISIVITHPSLAQLVKRKIRSLPPISDDFLLHKHMLRDRSDILRMREEKRNGRR